jgi:hypothetical protein
VKEIARGRRRLHQGDCDRRGVHRRHDALEARVSEEEIHAAVDEAAKAGTFVAAHAHGAEGIKNAIRAGVRTIEHGSYLDDEGIQLMLQHGTWLVADIYNGDYTEEVGTRDRWPEEIMRKNRETTDIQRQAFAKAVKAGVRIAFGTDAGIYPHGDNAKQFAYMVKYGMTPLEAIRAATTSAAASLGRSQELGSISPGKYGDMIAVAATRSRTSTSCSAYPASSSRRADQPGESRNDKHAPARLGMATALVVGNTIGMGIFMQPGCARPVRAQRAYRLDRRHRRLRLPRHHASPRSRGSFRRRTVPFGYVRSTLGESLAFPVLWSYWISCWVTLPVLAIGTTGYFLNVFPALRECRPAVIAVRSCGSSSASTFLASEAAGACRS